MITVKLNEANFEYDIYSLIKAFYPQEEILVDTNPKADQEKVSFSFAVTYAMEQITITWKIKDAETTRRCDVCYQDRNDTKNRLKRLLYEILQEISGRELPWGTLTGIRPTKIPLRMLEEGADETAIRTYMKDTYLISEEKETLCTEIAKKEHRLLAPVDYENGYSLYIGIPFCPTTCSYCSFTSYPVAKWQDRMDEYVDALLKELAFIAEVSKEKHLNAIYMGGGTPTTLSAQQMDRVLSFLEEHFSFEHLKEYTIEAGRPDSITEDKLRVIRKHGVGRISDHAAEDTGCDRKTSHSGGCSPHFPSGKRTGIRQYQYGSDRRSSGRTSGGDGRYSSSDQRACTGQFDGPCTCNETWLETDTRTGCKHRKTKLQTDGKRAGRDDRYGT